MELRSADELRKLRPTRPPNSFYDQSDKVMYINSNQGINDLLVSIVHEGTHALDDNAFMLYNFRWEQLLKSEGRAWGFAGEFAKANNFEHLARSRFSMTAEAFLDDIARAYDFRGSTKIIDHINDDNWDVFLQAVDTIRALLESLK